MLSNRTPFLISSLSIVCSFFLLAQEAYALTSNQIDRQMQHAENRQERLEDRQTNQEERQDNREELRAKRQEDLEAAKENREAKVQQAIHNQCQAYIRRMSSAGTRNQTIRENISKRYNTFMAKIQTIADRLDKKGCETTEIKTVIAQMEDQKEAFVAEYTQYRSTYDTSKADLVAMCESDDLDRTQLKEMVGQLKTGVQTFKQQLQALRDHYWRSGKEQIRSEINACKSQLKQTQEGLETEEETSISVQ